MVLLTLLHHPFPICTMVGTSKAPNYGELALLPGTEGSK